MNDVETHGPEPETEDAAADQQIVVARQVYPPRLSLIGLPNRPIFPKIVAPYAVETPAHVALVKEAMEAQHRLVGLVLSRDADGVGPVDAEWKSAVPELYGMGVVAQILKIEEAPTGQMKLLFGGLDRFEITRVLAREPYVVADVSYRYEVNVERTDEIKAYTLAVINLIKELVLLSPLFKEELNLLAQGSFEDPGRLADLAAFMTSASGPELQRVLETMDLRRRLERVLDLLNKELDIAKLQTRIRQQLEERVNKQQREFFLREQLKQIKKELGLEQDDKEAELSRFLERLNTRTVSDEAKIRIDDEIDKLRVLEPASPEFNVTRNYLDWLTILPWGVQSKEQVTLAGARQALDDSHYGLSDVKDRILEFVAAGLLKGSFGGSIICLVGPPGVGKTSIGKAIAAALGRQFYRFSLGGMQDEAEIKGHRRTYIGAMPGKFIQALRVTQTNNPVIMLDEIDKIGQSYRGDPASALLETLDPEQNREFLDHYLDVRFDLSNVLFVCTANQLDTIPSPLLDRMEVIKLSGYLLEEKLAIAKRFIVPRELATLGAQRKNLIITQAALKELAEGYARDAGVRTLEQQIRKVVRKSALRLLEGKADKIRIDAGDVAELLGKRVFREDLLRQRPKPGVVMGLAWTSMGGDTLLVEASAVPGNSPGFKQTGQLGKVMIESSEIAYTVARQLCSSRPGCESFFDKNFVHLHVPAGATPKDGPSAGITMALALYSLATRRAPKLAIAMTGELNLSGQVMPIGGIREKLIAAKRAKLKQVIMPRANQPDFEELPDYVPRGLDVHFVDTFDQVIQLALG